MSRNLMYKRLMYKPAQFVTLQLLRAYKWAISPMFRPACRYVPTCSEYAMEAVERYGALRGGWMALGRLLRCHPLARAGYDPVVRRRTEGHALENHSLESHFVENHSMAQQALEKCGACAPRI